MSPCMGLIGSAGEGIDFIGGTNVMCECRAYFCLLVEKYAQSCCPPTNSDSNYIALEINSLWITIRDRNVVLLWDRVSGFCVNDSQIFLTAGADTTL